MSINFSGEYSNSGGGGHPISFLDARYLNVEEEITAVTALTNRVGNFQSQLNNFQSQLNPLSARLTTLERLLEDHTHRIGVFQNFQVRSAVLHEWYTPRIRELQARVSAHQDRITALDNYRPGVNREIQIHPEEFRVRASRNSADAPHALDSNPDTSWTSTENEFSWYEIEFISSRPRKLFRIVMQGSIPRGWLLVGVTSTEKTQIPVTLGSDVKNGRIESSGYFHKYRLQFGSRVILSGLKLYELRCEIKNLAPPTEILDATPKLYVDNAFKNVPMPTADSHAVSKLYVDNAISKLNVDNAASKLYVDNAFKNVPAPTAPSHAVPYALLPKGIKDYQGYIPRLKNIYEYQKLGFNVTASQTLTSSSPWNVLLNLPDSYWVMSLREPPTSPIYLEIQLPESIRIWRFSILGNQSDSKIQSESKNQPKSITLMAGNEAIFRTLDADLTHDMIKYFEVQTQNKYSKYRLQINSATSDSDRIVIQSIQLYAVLDLVT